jgi:hypothetical protein
MTFRMKYNEVMPQLPGTTNSSSRIFRVGKCRKISVREPTKLFPESQRVNLDDESKVWVRRNCMQCK